MCSQRGRSNGRRRGIGKPHETRPYYVQARIPKHEEKKWMHQVVGAAATKNNTQPTKTRWRLIASQLIALRNCIPGIALGIMYARNTFAK